jgi:hypothetical protein
LLLAKAQPEQRDSGQVERDNRVIDPVQSHDGMTMMTNSNYRGYAVSARVRLWSRRAATREL